MCIRDRQGFDGMTSITVAGDGYISLDAYDSGWSLLKLAGENEARIRKEFDGIDMQEESA